MNNMKYEGLHYQIPSSLAVSSDSIIFNVNYTLMMPKYTLKIYSFLLFKLQNQVHPTAALMGIC